MTSSQHFKAGVAAGYASQIVCHPFDVIRTAYQANVATSSASVTETIMSLARRGFSTFYKGLLPPLLGQGVYKGIIFSVNSISNERLLNGGTLSVHAKIFASGTIAGTANSFVVAPVELIRTRLIIHEGKRIVLSKVIKELLASGGVLGLWRSVFATVLRDGPGLGFYFLAFHQAKQELHKHSSMSQQSVSSLSFPRKVLAASLAGAAFWIYALPVDTVKTLIEASSAKEESKIGSVRTLRGMWSKGATNRLINAYPIAILRGIPASVVTLLTHDVMLRRL